MKKTIDSLLHAGWIIPGKPLNKVLQHYSIALQHGKIVDILPTEKANTQYHAEHNHDLTDHILFPGLINMHGHSAMTLMRGLADDLPLMTWLNDHIWPAEGQWMSENFVEDGVRLAVAEMLRSGTTYINDMYFFPEVAGRVFDETGFQATLGMLVIEFPTAWAKDADEYFEKSLALHDQFHNHPRISTAFAPHAPYTVSDESFERIATIANELDCNIHVHLHETAHEVQESEQQHGKRPIQRLLDLGIVGNRLQAVHMTQLNDDEIKLMAQHNCSVIHCPESNLKLGSGISPVAKLLKKGVNVCLGTDGTASNNDLDMLGEMRTAALLAKGSTQDPTQVSAAQALHMATMAGAKALGLDKHKGSLEKGKDADIVALKITDLEAQPLYNPISHLVYSASRHQITDVWIQGKHLMHNRHLTTVDEKEVIARAIQWQQRLKA